jgi:hypothetical protein
MTHTVDIWKGLTKLGSGTGTADSASITSYSGTEPINGRNVLVTCTSGTNATGRTYRSRVVSGSGSSTLVMFDKDPFAD